MTRAILLCLALSACLPAAHTADRCLDAAYLCSDGAAGVADAVAESAPAASAPSDAPSAPSNDAPDCGPGGTR